ncbi:MAG: hypothetical protein JWO86_3756 [Myxococcaceae bacterium]|nr:hypothetical protein [Myxococcaceae bacterium]
MFLILMVIGLVGLAMMAIPAFARHGTAPAAHGTAHLPGHGPIHGPAHGHAHLPAHPPAHAPAHASHADGPDHEMLPAPTAARSGIARWVPSPRGVFTALALFGAFGNVFIDAFHLPLLVAALAAVVPTLVVERFAVRPLWNLVFRFQAQPCASLDQLILGEAVAVVAFRNGRGIVSTNREGRNVQLRASLVTDQASQEVGVGDRLRIEDVDAPNERVTVSVLPRE